MSKNASLRFEKFESEAPSDFALAACHGDAENAAMEDAGLENAAPKCRAALGVPDGFRYWFSSLVF